MGRVKSYSELKRNDAYALEQEVKLNDVAGVGFVLRHKKTGARVAIISNDDENKVFGIGFRTPPENSTGVPHIIEHSVLCGSERYPAKDPFMELEKSSVNTFLNAMTYPDKTIYPVASCNDKDFSNLVRVYVDAVFNPAIYKKKEFFLQEGWRYELENKEDDITLNGVVYSEMKGVYSSPESLVDYKVQETLFPDMTYGFSSGGDPDVIPELSYEDYLNFHEKHYHPTNSYITLYGNMDIEEYLEFFDKEYLSYYDYAPVDSAVRPQKPLGECVKKTFAYAASENETPEKNSFITKAFVAGNQDDIFKIASVSLLDTVLFSAPGAPVKQALIDAELCEDVSSYFEYEILQPFFSINAKNANAKDAEKFEKILTEALEKQVKEGIKEDSLRAAISSSEFRYREADFGRYPKGIFYLMDMYNTWLYDDKNVFSYIDQSWIYTKLYEKIGTGYFENLIKEVFLDSKHCALITAVPDSTVNEKKEEALKKKLADLKASMTDEELDALVEQTRNLKIFQETPDSKEAIAAIPKLSLSDIGKKAREIKMQTGKLAELPYVHADYDTNGIAYFQLYFDITDFPEKDIPYIGLLSRFIGRMDAGEYGYLDLSNEINIMTGGIGCGNSTTVKYASGGDYIFHFSVSGKTLYKNMKRACELTKLLITETKLDDRKRLKELVLETKARFQSYMNYNSDDVATRRAAAYLYPDAYLTDVANGVSFYGFICELADNFTERADELIENLKRIYKEIIVRNRLTVMLNADAEGEKLFKAEFGKLTEELPEGKKCGKAPKFDLKVKREGLYTAGQVQYAVKAVDFGAKGLSVNGSVYVLRNIINMDYLYNSVRVKGGAYGVGVRIGRDTKSLSYFSYRDPNLKETLDVYDKTADFIRGLDLDKEALDNYIISTTGGMDSPLTPSMLGTRAFNAYFSGVTVEDLQRERDEVLNTKPDDLKKLAEIFDLVKESEAVCVVGYEGKLRENKELFGEIKPLC